MVKLAVLSEQLEGCRVAELVGRDGDAGPELQRIVFNDGTVLRFNWRAGSSTDHVGVDVDLPIRRRRGRGCFRVS